MVIRGTQRRWPMTIYALVLLPDHLHAMWTLPPGDAAYAVRWAWLKKEFTRRFLNADGSEQPRSESRRRNRRRDVRRRRYWEHLIRDEDDFDSHFDYLHWNPRKHGYVQAVSDWPHSTFHRWVRAGVYPPNLGSTVEQPGTVARLRDAGE